MSGFTSGCGRRSDCHALPMRDYRLTSRRANLSTYRTPSLSLSLTDWLVINLYTFTPLLRGACVRSQPGTRTNTPSHTLSLSLSLSHTHSLAMNSCRTGTVALSGTSLGGCSSIHQFSVAHLLTLTFCELGRCQMRWWSCAALRPALCLSNFRDRANSAQCGQPRPRGAAAVRYTDRSSCTARSRLCSWCSVDDKIWFICGSPRHAVLQTLFVV